MSDVNANGTVQVDLMREGFWLIVQDLRHCRVGRRSTVLKESFSDITFDRAL
jgi:hypothetical protein